MPTETLSLLPAKTCWDFQMFDAQRLKIKTVIVNSSSQMHVTRAYFFVIRVNFAIWINLQFLHFFFKCDLLLKCTSNLQAAFIFSPKFKQILLDVKKKKSLEYTSLTPK